MTSAEHASAPICLFFGLLAVCSVPLSAQKCIEMNTNCPGKGWVKTSCDNPDPCGTGGGGSAPDYAAIERAAAAAREQERKARVAFDNGEAELARGNLSAAAKFYSAALQLAPGNATYKKRRAAVLLAMSGGNSALEELRGAAIDSSDAAGSAGEASSDTGERSFDRGGTRAPAQAPPASTADDSVSVELARRLELGVNLKDPANAAVASAMSKVEYMLKYNLNAVVKGAYPEDPAALQKNVDELNKTLPPGTEPVTVEKAEAAFTGYRLGLREAAKDKEKDTK